MTGLYHISEHMSSIFFDLFMLESIFKEKRKNLPREKQQRELNFKPTSKYFGPKDIKSNEDIILLHEEIQAIKLMDLDSMYQEDAAIQMNISRPTLARIIKNARLKIASALINGSNIKVHEIQNDFNVAVCSNQLKVLDDISIDSKYIFILHIKDYKLENIKHIQNPAFSENNIRPRHVLPTFLKEENIHYFITKQIGITCKKYLIDKGIYPIIKEEISLDEIVNIFK